MGLDWHSGFICDTMFGKLARWMRFCGLDTLYPDTMDDSSLAQMAIQTKRILITRDKQFKFRKNLCAIVIGEEGVDKQFEKLCTELNIVISVRDDSKDIEINGKVLPARCPLCNSVLITISAEEYRKGYSLAAQQDRPDDMSGNERVPEAVLSSGLAFYRCTGKGCSKFYWHGTHWDRIIKTLKSMTQKRG
ncbi:MAG: Mut7-C RNAse domain-containing protein [Thermoplasmata archaeon]